jgi:hypothetical protein
VEDIVHTLDNATVFFKLAIRKQIDSRHAIEIHHSHSGEVASMSWITLGAADASESDTAHRFQVREKICIAETMHRCHGVDTYDAMPKKPVLSSYPTPVTADTCKRNEILRSRTVLYPVASTATSMTSILTYLNLFTISCVSLRVF